MRLARTDPFQARWTDMIHDEWMRNVLAQHPDDFTFDLLDLHPGGMRGSRQPSPVAEEPTEDGR